MYIRFLLCICEHPLYFIGSHRSLENLERVDVAMVTTVL